MFILPFKLILTMQHEKKYVISKKFCFNFAQILLNSDEIECTTIFLCGYVTVIINLKNMSFLECNYSDIMKNKPVRH